ncbi:hypothetical protein [Entomomonas asaccharolytica]|uniref:Uncharacterized protein n=1 Tax=Entomomonas asaccharolytica TaxID=2785331 RepID=A0A974NG69_9GAMM|nr:hypothetical protein [Entomomonas asaccharolytica]QQP86190.1 hypothetical protein JHT90_02785 [Entomomonas asaccharolytica]
MIYAQKTERTEFDVCLDMVAHFNKQAVATLFDVDDVVVIRADQYLRPGCNVLVRAGANFNEKNLLEILVYKQNNAYEIYKKDLQSSKSKTAVQVFNDSKSSWYNAFSWAKEGYYEYVSGKFQLFHFYTQQGDYITFTFYLTVPSKSDKPNKQELDDKMQSLINIIAKQMAYY